MHTIGFKNFRRFEELKPMELSGITFFVGGNNAGKSTVAKAMMLVYDNIIRHDETASQFRLGSNSARDIHVGTFGRALHKPYPEVHEIEFESKIEAITFRYVIAGDVESQRLSADIHVFEIRDDEQKWSIEVNYNEGKILLTYPKTASGKIANNEIAHYGNIYSGSYSQNNVDAMASEINLQEMIDHLDKELAALRESLEISDEIRAALIRNEIKLKEAHKKTLQQKQKVSQTSGRQKEATAELTFADADLREFPDLFRMIDALVNAKQQEYQASYEAKGTDYKQRAELEALIGDCDNIQALSRYARYQIRNISYTTSMVYIPSHSVSQRVFFSREDRNDYMSDVIGKYQIHYYSEGSKPKLFVQKWMKNFGIGLNYRIDTIQGEAFTVTVTNVHGDEVPLADLGMGSIQLFLLLLKLATLIDEKRIDKPLVLVEEPEQNIHPKLQSMLAELFESVYKEYGFHFLIETHSEYMIRKTQAMIATEAVKFEDNPFRVYYFPENEIPYDMVYQRSGLFENKFDEGFFDEASRQHVAVIKKARELQ